MYFNNFKVRNFFAEYFRWSEEQMLAMMHQYYSTVNRMIIDDCIDYIEKNDLPEKAEFEKLLQDNKAKRSNPDVEAELIQFLVQLPGKYPELEEQEKKKIYDLDESMLKDTMDALDEPAAIKLLQIINQDLDDMKRFSDRYLNPNKQNPQ